MEWYFESGVDDLVVPRDQEFSDGLPSSPGIMSEWGTYAHESFVSPNKYLSMDTNSVEENFNFNGFCSEVDIEASVQNKGHSSGSSVCAGSSEESLQRTAPSSNRPYCQLDHFAGIEELDDILDDIYLNSLLEDLPATEDLYNSFGFDPESQHNLTGDNLAADMTLDSKSHSGDTHARGCSKYLKTHAFSPSVGWEYEDDVASPFSSCNSQHKFLSDKATLAKLQVPSEQNIANELVREETTPEESVLQELRIVMTRMNDKTRICFRDALYRLSESSKQCTDMATSRQNGDGTAETPPKSGSDTNMRSGKDKAMESETNFIDRAIANLLFNKMEPNVRGLPIVASKNPKQELIEETGSPKYSFTQPPTHQFCEDMLTGDAEVPTFGGAQQAVATASSKDF